MAQHNSRVGGQQKKHLPGKFTMAELRVRYSLRYFVLSHISKSHKKLSLQETILLAGEISGAHGD
jgi:hypothetical protein